MRGVNSFRLVMLALLPVARITNRPSRSARTSDSWYAFSELVEYATLLLFA